MKSKFSISLCFLARIWHVPNNFMQVRKKNKHKFHVQLPSINEENEVTAILKANYY